MDSSAQHWRRGRLSAAPAPASVTLTSLDVDVHPGWCAAATSELHPCLRRCDDASLRMSEQICLSRILMGNSFMCAGWYLNCTLLILTAQRPKCKNAILSRRGKKKTNFFVLFFPLFSNQFIQDSRVGAKIHINEAWTIRCVAEFQNFCCLFLILAVWFAVFPERRSNVVLVPSAVPQTWRKTESNRKKNKLLLSKRHL